MGPLIALSALALVALVALSLWRGRLVSVALAASECPDCHVPLVSVCPEPDKDASWEIFACPNCDRVVTAVGDLPSPVAECPACKQKSLVIYAERGEEGIVVDEWCDLCARRARTVVGAPIHKTNGDTPSPMGRVLPFRREG